MNHMREMLGDEYPAFLRAMEAPPALALRLNPRRKDAEGAAESFVEGPVPWEPLGRYLRPCARPGASIAHAAGAFYVQEASAMASAAVLNARPGERVLDLCAAPGGKSTQIAAAMDNRGLLVSNDPELSRAKALAGNLERMGAANAVVVSALPDQLAARWPETFDAILVDAPCSGEGMFRRDLAARQEWSAASPEGCAKRQAEILDRAAEMLKPGGRLVYSTCTFNRSENDGSILRFLERHPDFSYEDFALEGVGTSTNGMLRLLPHRVRGDGHFVARLRKAGSEDSAPKRSGKPTRVKSSASPDVPKLLAQLERDVCAMPEDLRAMRTFLQGDRLYCAPQETPALDGIRVVSPGLCLLRAGRSHVEPEHALAMALPPEAARSRVGLTEDQAEAWLRGEVLSVENVRGWTLVLYRGMPLGWGKASDGALKNHLPRGLRRPGR